MQRRDINAPDGPAPAGAYSQAVEVSGASRTLYLSGQVGVGADGQVPEDATAQARLVWANIQAQLRAAGMTLDNLVKITTILPNHADLAATRVARTEALGERKPASTLIIGGLASPAWKIEIEAIAYA
ncbi:MAG: enamine deaminase RidA [Acetobacteraceae bacterium SCN 69-10]|nr:RidA family protein [Rhodospirillales bacterium]ODU61947.1 MAG: enamine deaminase RidA [Acetobacteraceae bacterium SCN 69-10]OJY70524.1 MAG: enamine deaminase RidA [Rhodospirillales bacterium 70-18]